MEKTNVVSLSEARFNKRLDKVLEKGEVFIGIEENNGNIGKLVLPFIIDLLSITDPVNVELDDMVFGYSHISCANLSTGEITDADSFVTSGIAYTLCEKYTGADTEYRISFRPTMPDDLSQAVSKLRVAELLNLNIVVHDKRCIIVKSFEWSTNKLDGTEEWFYEKGTGMSLIRKYLPS